ncbi:helix-turn-helix transcriptional regulator [Herbaspirillum frisingense]|uniref:helix-turn-helix domain-containing protein n=1 Tax=Herbaspirillum frisingense TaxID=92645 RepID=UPI0016005589|nr:helix-turn-helix transcriptional regulator [Herbaspirillum frisingense]QNB06022.1 helix-turn-helix transcriptional regulator [Herbaspirillum frisingense]
MPNPIHQSNYALFREMLTNIRLEKGLLQSEVAERLGKPQSFISKYERGERRLDFAEFVEIAKALDIDAAAFVAQYQARLGKS